MSYSGSSLGSSLGYDFNPSPILEEIDKAKEAHISLVVAINEANAQAEARGKPKLELWPIPGY